MIQKRLRDARETMNVWLYDMRRTQHKNKEKPMTMRAKPEHMGEKSLVMSQSMVKAYQPVSPLKKSQARSETCF